MQLWLPSVDEPYASSVRFFQPDYHIAGLVIEVEDPAQMFHQVIMLGILSFEKFRREMRRVNVKELRNKRVTCTIVPGNLSYE